MHEFKKAGKDDEKGRFIQSIIPTFFVANWLEISKQQKNGFRIRILKPLCLQSEMTSHIGETSFLLLSIVFAKIIL